MSRLMWLGMNIQMDVAPVFGKAASKLTHLDLQNLDGPVGRKYPLGIWTGPHWLRHAFRKSMAELPMPKATSGHPLLSS